MRTFSTIRPGLLAILCSPALAISQEKPTTPSTTIEGVKGVKQEAVESVKPVTPPTANPVAESAAEGVKKVDGVNTIDGVKTPAPNAVQPVTPPPPANPVAPNTAEGMQKVDGVNTIDGVKTPAPNTVQPVPPPPAGNAVSSIRAVQGVQGIDVPKQRNLEAALQIKQGTGPADPKAAAAAAALLGPPGNLPGPPDVGDGRADFQEFEKLNTPGS